MNSELIPLKKKIHFERNNKDFKKEFLIRNQLSTDYHEV